MFRKKFLNFITLLFISSQFILNVKASDCKYGTAVIASGSTCDGSIKLINKAGDDVINDATTCISDSECTLVTCTNGEEECTKGDVTGYITLLNKLLTCSHSVCTYVNTSGGAYINALENKPIKCTSSTCTTSDKDSCTAAGDVIYSSGTYFCPTNSDSDKFEIISDNVKIYHYLTVANNANDPITGTNNAGEEYKILITTGNGGTVLDNISTLTQDSVDYLVIDGDGALENKGKGVAVTYNGSILVKKATIKGDKEYCVGNNSVIKGTREAYCSNMECTNGYYLCTDGVCERQDNIQCPTSVLCTSSIPVNGGCTIPGYYLTKSQDDKDLQSANTPGTLFLCTEYKCEIETPKVGYYKYDVTTIGDYIRCDGTNCIAITATATSTGCDQDGVKIGDIINLNTGTYQICYGTGTNEGFPISTPGKKLITFASDGNNLRRSDSKTYILEIVNNNAFIQINASKDEFIIKKDATTLETTPTSQGTLLKCAQTTGVCEEETAAIGYYENAGSESANPIPYIKCHLDSTTIKCYPYVVAAVKVGDGCTATADPSNAALSSPISIGDIIKDGDAYQLCFGTSATTDGITLASTTAKYFIDISTSNIFGNKPENYVLINIENGNVLRDALTPGSIPRYRYTNNAHKESTNVETNMCAGSGIPGSEIVEFKYNQCDSENDTRVSTKQVNYYKIIIYN